MLNRLKKSKKGSTAIEYIIVFATIISFILVAMSTSGMFTESYWYVLNSFAWGLGNIGFRINFGQGGLIAGTAAATMGGSVYRHGNPITGSPDWGEGECVEEGSECGEGGGSSGD